MSYYNNMNLEQMFQNWLTGTKDMNLSLIEEMLEYNKERKAEIIYRKCLRLGKVDLANKIKIKYNGTTRQDDGVKAFELSLIKLKNGS